MAKTGKKFTREQREEIYNYIEMLIARRFSHYEICHKILPQKYGISIRQGYIYLSEVYKRINVDEPTKEQRRKETIRIFRKTINNIWRDEDLESFEKYNLVWKYENSLMKLEGIEISEEILTDNKLNIEVEIKDYEHTKDTDK